MPRFIPLKTVCRLLLLVLLTVSIDCGHASAYVTDFQVKAADSLTALSGSCDGHHCPCSPQGERADHDGCDTCAGGCSCHAPLLVHHFNLNYAPSLLDISTFDTFKYLPEVFLSKFVPPQLQA